VRNSVLAALILAATLIPASAKDRHKHPQSSKPGYGYRLPATQDPCDLANEASVTTCTNGG
jgi:hypothetical protein